MSLIELLAKAGLAVSHLRTFIVRAAAASPDLAPEAQKLIDQLDAATSPEQLSALAQTIVSELGDIGRGKLDGRDNPSNAA